MKAQFFKNLGSGLVLSALPFVGGSDQESTKSPPSIPSAAQAEPFIAPDDNAVAFAGEPVMPEASPPPPEDVAAPVPNPGKNLPPNIKPSSPAGEVVKLTQAGVDEAVMLTYVSNSTSMFNLSSDEIIYLNDIGVPASVVTTMIHRDQVLKLTPVALAPAESAAAQVNAPAAEGAAPSYVNPPQPETQPIQPVDAGGSPPPQPVNVTYNYFYDSLAPYGSWVDLPGYGSCWQPTVVVVNRAWRPYCNGGRWVYTDCGWYWYSDYSWGWAPFHYGRWVSDARLGWCWYPGYTWGPAWVSWRYSDGYCGWAPLPPSASYTYGVGFTYYGGSVGVSFGFGLGSSCYTFVPWNRFCGYKPYKYCAAPHQAQQIYQHSTVINNYISRNNNTIVNQGIPIDKVRRHTGAEIRQVSIRETRNTIDRTTRGERFERDGRTLVVRRPQIAQTSTVTAQPARFTGESPPGHTPSTSAGTSVQIEPSRDHGPDRSPVQSWTVFSGNSRTTPPRTGASSGDIQGAPRGRYTYVEKPDRNMIRGNNHPSPAAPLVVRREDRVPATPPATPPTTPSQSPAPASPRGSFVVIGRRDSNPRQMGYSGSSQRATPDSNTVQKSPSGSLIMIGRRDSSLSGEGNSTGDRPWTTGRTESLMRNNYNRPVASPTPATQPFAPAARGQMPRVSAATPPAPLSYNRPRIETTRYERYETSRQTAPAYTAPNNNAPRPSPMPARYNTSGSAPQRSQFGQSGQSRRNSN